MCGCGEIKSIHDNFAVAIWKTTATLVKYHENFPPESADISYSRVAAR